MPSKPHPCANPTCKRTTTARYCQNCYMVKKHEPKPATVNASQSWWAVADRRMFTAVASAQVERMQSGVWVGDREPQ